MVTVGLGLMVTSWVVVVPGHPWNDEVIVYVTVCWMFVTFINVTGVTGFAVPGVTGQGFTLPARQVADHEKLVPATVEVSVTGADEVPEQIDWPARHEMAATGLTFTLKSVTLPLQPLA